MRATTGIPYRMANIHVSKLLRLWYRVKTCQTNAIATKRANGTGLMSNPIGFLKQSTASIKDKETTRAKNNQWETRSEYFPSVEMFIFMFKLCTDATELSTVSAPPHVSATTTGRSHPSVAETRSCTRRERRFLLSAIPAFCSSPFQNSACTSASSFCNGVHPRRCSKVNSVTCHQYGRDDSP